MIYRTNKSTVCPSVNQSQKDAQSVPELWNVADCFVLVLFPVAIAIVLLAALFQVIEASVDRAQDHFYLYYKL